MKATNNGSRKNRTDAPDRLLQATSEILSERDTLEVSVSEISARSGLNHGLIRYHFNGKEGLLLALLKRDADASLAQLKHLIESEIPPIEKLRLHIFGVMRTYFRYPYINLLINYLQQSSEENARALSKFFVVPLHQYQSIIIDEAARNGLIRQIDSRLFYFLIIGACDQIFKSRRLLDDAFGIAKIDSELVEQYGQFLFDFVMHGISAPKPPAQSGNH